MKILEKKDNSTLLAEAKLMNEKTQEAKSNGATPLELKKMRARFNSLMRKYLNS